MTVENIMEIKSSKYCEEINRYKKKSYDSLLVLELPRLQEELLPTSEIKV